jgi:hypothetical protein
MPLGETPSSRSVDWYFLSRLAWRGFGGPTLVIPPCNSRGVVVRTGSIVLCWGHPQNVGCEATSFQHAVGDQCGEQFYTDVARSTDLSLKRSVLSHAPPYA